jgi:inner membrane protein
MSHAVVALGVGACFKGPALPTRVLVAGALCAMAPDVDVTGLAVGFHLDHPLGHRGLTHSLPFAAALAVIVTALLIGPLCGSSREFCTRCDPQSGPRRAERARRYWQPGKGSAGIPRAEPLAGSRRAPGARDGRPGAIAAYLFLATASHGILDALTNGGRGVAFLAPFSEARVHFGFRPIEVSPIGLGAFFTARGIEILRSELIWIWMPILLLTLMAWTARRRQTTN